MKIAILGLGTVGLGAMKASELADDIEVKKILIRSDKDIYEELTTTDYNEILADDEIELIALCIGGLHPAYEYAVSALKSGKHLVTPNKNLVSCYFKELSLLAEENNVKFKFTSSAGGGVPWLLNLNRHKNADEILEVMGIVNGTCNYILSNMFENRVSFDEILKQAQSLGFAEQDPSSDIDGYDTQRKCVISANVGFDTYISEKDVPVFGIRNISESDISFFTGQGYCCKLTMHAGLLNGRLFAYVEPTLFPFGAPFASTGSNYNFIALKGANMGILGFYGEGAGGAPTGTSVILDAIDVLRESSDLPHTDFYRYEVDNRIIKHRYYMHLKNYDNHIDSSIIESKTADGDDTFLTTVPVSVAEAHSIANNYNMSGGIFMAGIKEEQ